MKVAVIGGGISGLTAAFELKKASLTPDLYEAKGTLGGVMRTSGLGGVEIVEEGADAFLGRVPWGYELCKDLELEAELTSPVSAQVLIGERPIPAPHVLGVPLDMSAASLLGAEIQASVQADLNRSQIEEPALSSETVGSLVRRRLGDLLYEQQVAPLIGAISASDPDLLSAEVAAPLLVEAAKSSPSLIKGLQQIIGNGSSSSPVPDSKPKKAFYAPRGGMQEIIKRLEEALAGHIHLNTKIQDLKSPQSLNADALILAVPAYISAKLLAEISPLASELLSQIQYVSVAMSQLVCPAEEIPDKFRDLAGILIPPEAGYNITAISFATQKWAHYTDENLAVIRVSVGRYNQQEIVQKPESEILDLVQEELKEIFEVPSPFSLLASRVSKWEHSFPQYFPGHLQKMSEVESELAPHKIYLAGSSLKGVGIPACIETGKIAAAKILNEN